MSALEWVRSYCLTFPHATETVQWGNDLVFKVEGKMFAVLALEQPSHVFLSFKCTDEEFAELVERPHVIPAPYLARAKWVGLEKPDAIPVKELRGLLRASFDLVVGKLPKKIRLQIQGA